MAAESGPPLRRVQYLFAIPNPFFAYVSAMQHQNLMVCYRSHVDLVLQQILHPARRCRVDPCQRQLEKESPSERESALPYQKNL